MSQTKLSVHKIKISNRNPATPLTGFNAIVEIDGQPLKGVTFLKLELKPNKIAKIVIEMVADVEIEETAVEI